MQEFEYKPKKDDLTWTFGGTKPVKSIKPPAIVKVWTEDAFGGALTRTTDKFTDVVLSSLLNPQTGPFLIEGAEPGDTVAVHFVSIEPARSWGVSTTVPYFGALTPTPLTPMLEGVLEERVWIYEVDTDRHQVGVNFERSGIELALPLEPMHGTIGVAPRNMEVRSALVPGDFGGNMDAREVRVGSTCFLGVNVEGAMLSLGDGHCRQGEGESCGVAVEAAMNTTVCIDLMKGTYTPWPRIVDEKYLMSIGSSRPLEDAFRIAHHDMITWISSASGLDHLDAYQLVTQVAETPVANACDPNYSIVCKVPNEYVPKSTPYNLMHQGLADAVRGFAA